MHNEIEQELSEFDWQGLEQVLDYVETCVDDLMYLNKLINDLIPESNKL